jgi:tetratricopeptide (TPR) repeat protein
MNGSNDLSNGAPQPLDADRYRFWIPEPGRQAAVGPEQVPVVLPQVPLPVLRTAGGDPVPSDDAIGKSVYEYLRQFPDCPHNRTYAGLLRDAFPQYIADLGAHALLLERKDVSAAYIQRKLVCLKILALLDPDNPALLQQLGLVCLDLGMQFEELPRIRQHLLGAFGYLRRALKQAPEQPATLYALGQINYLWGDYPAAIALWQNALAHLAPHPSRNLLQERLQRLESSSPSDHPLIDDLESIGEAMLLYGQDRYADATALLEQLLAQTEVVSEFPMPEFFFLLGQCRHKIGDPAGALDGFDRALELNPDFAPALSGKTLLLNGGE